MLQAQEYITDDIDQRWTSSIMEERTLVNDDDPCNFTYVNDTIDLPFIDDFSTNLQRQFDAVATDAFTDTLYYNLYISGVPEPDTVMFMDQVSYHIYRDTLADGTDTSWSDTIMPFLVEVCDPCTYPLSCTFQTVYYNFDIVDTVYLGTTDTIWYTADYVQDTLRRYFIPDGTGSLWQDRNACINGTFPVGPPTIGVATMDALDEYGYPYNFVNTSLTGTADYLTSVPINLGIDPGDFLPYEPSDSIYLSFYYQPQGLGNDPETNDSLILEFWSPDSLQWYRVWGAGGTALAPFDQVLVPVIEDKYLESGFQFRFKNYATLSGALDHWHIDYVRMFKNRNINDTLIDDIAVRYPANTLIDDYTAMHWHHFMTNPTLYMIDTIHINYNNISTFDKTTTSGMVVERNGSVLNSFLHPGVISNLLNLSDTLWQHKIQGDYFFEYDTALADTCISFDVKFWCTTTPDARRENDTSVFTQHFSNYYAYDDGSAEHGYFLSSGGSPPMLAYQYTIPVSDSLTGFWIYWLPVGESSENESFFLTVWDNASGQPGSAIYQSATFNKPIYGLGSKNQFAWYPLDQPDGSDTAIAVSGTFYVGYQQASTDPLKIGMDKNRNNQDKIFYNVGGGWNNTGFEGSLMLRPAFVGDKHNLLLHVEEPTIPIQFTMYPNPAQDQVAIYMDDDFNMLDLMIHDMTGRMIYQEQFQGMTNLDVSNMVPGMYLVNLYDPATGRTATTKLAIQR